ncbi:hypothetical protein NLG97_g6116 [Lecanicillium saksenae]|uniref:Uncharacterized protein n=1 Tax=Lecanicillium saksenae TaxID=468837 RepID=A0ACC1QRQ0_9HYPO|nr:hypothetical protein NLG97_g6116 [Lecanicillium saksenae]
MGAAAAFTNSYEIKSHIHILTAVLFCIIRYEKVLGHKKHEKPGQARSAMVGPRGGDLGIPSQPRLQQCTTLSSQPRIELEDVVWGARRRIHLHQTDQTMQGLILVQRLPASKLDAVRSKKCFSGATFAVKGPFADQTRLLGKLVLASRESGNVLVGVGEGLDASHFFLDGDGEILVFPRARICHANPEQTKKKKKSTRRTGIRGGYLGLVTVWGLIY